VSKFLKVTFSSSNLPFFILFINFLYCKIKIRPDKNRYYCTRTRDTQREFFFQKSEICWLGQTFWAEIFWGIWGVLGQVISPRGPILVLWIPCPCFPLFNHYFYKKLSLGIHPHPKKYLFKIGIGIWIWIWIWNAKN
jgi:hypothetical protein